MIKCINCNGQETAAHDRIERLQNLRSEMFTDREIQLLMQGLEATISILQTADNPETYEERIKELRTLKNKLHNHREETS